MSAFDCSCSPCEPTTIVEVPGSAGEPGADGINAFTETTAEFTIPAKGDDVIVQVENNSWVGEDSYVFVENGGWFSVSAVSGDTFLTLVYLDIPANVNAGNGLFAGALVTPSGPPISITPPGALTDNSGATASDIIAAGVGITTIAFTVQLASLTTAAADLITNYTPGYAFKILSVDFVVTTLGAGAGASQILNLEIVSTNLTGGVVTLTLANTTPLGVLVAGTAVTGNNVGTASDTISIEVAAGGTVFTSGEGVLLIRILNVDTANAIASLAAKANAIIAAI